MKEAVIPLEGRIALLETRIEGRDEIIAQRDETIVDLQLEVKNESIKWGLIGGGVGLGTGALVTIIVMLATGFGD